MLVEIPPVGIWVLRNNGCTQVTGYYNKHHMYYPPGYFECTRTTTHDNDNTYDTYERQDELIASGGVILYP